MVFRTAAGAVAKDNRDGTRVYVRDLVVTSGSSQSTTYLFVQRSYC